jgi:hypothetical protein
MGIPVNGKGSKVTFTELYKGKLGFGVKPNYH